MIKNEFHLKGFMLDGDKRKQYANMEMSEDELLSLLLQ